MTITTTPRYKNLLLALALIGFGMIAVPSHANVVTPSIDYTKELPKLDSINQLGELVFTVPTMHRFHTSTGVPVIFTPLDSLPIVDVSVAFLAGSGYDTSIDDKAYGLANMTATMLTQGTIHLSEDDFITQKENLGIDLYAGANKDMLAMSLRSLADKETLNQATNLMLDALANPRFDTAVLERNQDRLITSIRQQEQNPNYLAKVAFGKAIFGDHPYAYPITGTKESIGKLSTDQLKKFHQTYLVNGNATITITGKLSLDDAKRLADTISTALPKGDKAPSLPTPTTPKAKHIHVEYPSNQTSILIGNLTDGYANDEASLQRTTDFTLANDVLAGGDFSARLMDEIRVKKGYTYGISGGLQKMQAGGVYAISFATQTAMASNAINDTLKVINDTQSTGVSHDELNLALFNNKNSFPNSFASNAGIHGIATTMGFYELPDNYLLDYAKRLDNVSLANANTALNTVIQPSQFVIVSVGATKPDFDPKANSEQSSQSPSQ